MLNNKITLLKRLNKTFRVEVAGNIYKIFYNNTSGKEVLEIFKNKRDNKKRATKEQAKFMRRFSINMAKREKEGLISIKYHGENGIDMYKQNTKTDFMNIDTIRTLDNDVSMYYIDICNCHWDTAFRCGLIPIEMWRLGHSKDEWKKVRNICIGMLRRKKEVKYYENGKFLKTEYFNSKYMKYYHSIWNYINIFFKDISKEFEGKIVCGKDDSFFVRDMSWNDVLKLVKYSYCKFGYGLSTKRVKLEHLKIDSEYSISISTKSLLTGEVYKKRIVV